MLTVDGAGSAERLSSAESLGLVGSVGLRAALVCPIDTSSKGFTITTGAGHVDIVEDGATSFDDGDRHGRVLGQAVCDHQTGSTTADDDVVVSVCRLLQRGRMSEGGRCDCSQETG